MIEIGDDGNRNCSLDMGEAKRRKQATKFYGIEPKAGKGIVVSPKVSIKADGKMLLSTFVDPVELRRAVLFWDRINKPINNIVAMGLSPDESFLQECGVLKQFEIVARGVSGQLGHLYAKLHLEAFNQLEASEPGQWCMSEGENSFNLEARGVFSEGRGALVELHRAIPLPVEDTPLHDLLEFKEKRRDEIKSLKLELDGLFSRVIGSEDSAHELERAISEIDQKCSDVIKVGRESAIAFSLSDFSFGVSFEAKSTNLIAGSVIGSVLGSTFSLPVAEATVAGAAVSTIKINAGIGGKLHRSSRDDKLALSPYRVVSRLINEPI